jgi:hypothetical protein
LPTVDWVISPARTAHQSVWLDSCSGQQAPLPRWTSLFGLVKRKLKHWLIAWLLALYGSLQIAFSLLKVFDFQFAPVKPSRVSDCLFRLWRSTAEGNIAFRPNARKWTEYNFTRIRVKQNAPPNNFQLKRANMLGVILSFCLFSIKCVGLLNVAPAALSPVDPVVSAYLAFGIDLDLVIAWLAKLNKVILKRPALRRSIVFKA